MAVPGLNIDAVAPGLVDAQFGSVLGSIENAEDREAKRNELIEFFKTGDGSAEIQEKINLINDLYDTTDAALTSVATTPPLVVALKAVPAVLVVGQATGTPNPGFGSSLCSAFKGIVQAVASLAEGQIKTIAYYCASIGFDSTSAVTTLNTKLTAAKSAADTL